MIKRTIFPAVLILLLTPNMAQACYNSGVNHCQMIHVGLLSIVFGLASGYATRTAGNRFFRSLFKINAGLYGLYILFVPMAVNYRSECGFLVLLILLIPPMALALVIALAFAAGNAGREASDEGPGAARLGFSSAGLLLGTLAIFFFTYSSDVPSHRAYDSDAKANLHNYFLACRAYWADEGGDNTCSIEIAQRASYGFNQSARVKIMTEAGNESSFTAFATHQESYCVFKQDPAGDIEESADSPFPPPLPPKTRWELFLRNIGVSTMLAG